MRRPYFIMNMKKFKSFKNFYLASAAAICAVFAAIVYFAFPAPFAQAKDNSEYGAYAFYYEEFSVNMNVSSDRKIEIEEYLTVVYNGTSNTGFMRDIPVNGGELVKHVSVTEFINGKEVFVPYTVEPYDDDTYTYITANIGSSSLKSGMTCSYILRYTYCLTKAQEGNNVLALNVIGPQDRRVEHSDVKILLPDGYLNGTYILGVTGSENGKPLTTHSENGRSFVQLENLAMDHDEGLTVNLNFEDGALSTYFDFTPFIFVIIAVLLILIILAIKFIKFNRHALTPVVNFEAPDKMDPLMMGKLIDGVVDQEDVTAMIFYWAHKGYLKINLENEKRPVLIRITQKLPEGTPSYEKLLFDDLFGRNDAVTPETVSKNYYKSVNRAADIVNSRTKQMYDKKSNAIAIILAVIAALLLGIAPLACALATISLKFYIPSLLIGFFCCIPMVFIFVTFSGTLTLRFKKKWSNIAAVCATALLALAFATIFYLIVIPAGIISTIPRVCILISCTAAVACSPIIISRTKEYTEQLNEILGFKKFITLAEKDRLEKMLDSDPQLYYHVLPYAQVLGVSDKWEDKFKNIPIAPPAYATYSAANSLITFHIINSSMRSMSRNFVSHMSPPSSGGGSGRGGFSGGHGGGGHGGGGSRGR